ncbi:Voltage-gated potassium channel subunit beta, partial [Globisporangium splendens]
MNNSAAPKTKMPHRFLGNTGLLVSTLSLGSWVHYSASFGVDEVFAIARHAFTQHGINFFDNAEGYGAGQAEQVLGEVVQRGIQQRVWTREDLVLVTKIFLGTKSGPNNQGLSRKHIVEGTRASLKRLQVENVDVLYCHRPEPYTPLEEIVRAMNFVIGKGWAMYWGTSDWSSHDIIKACEIADRLKLMRPVVEQAAYNVFDRYKVEFDYVPLYQKYKLGLTIYSPMAASVLTGRYASGIAEGSRLAHPQYRLWYPDLDERIVKAEQLRQLAKEHLGCTLPQLAFAWVVGNVNVTNVLVGASSLAQLDENVKALEVASRLSPEIRAKIDDIVQFVPKLPEPDAFTTLRSKYL